MTQTTLPPVSISEVMSIAEINPLDQSYHLHTREAEDFLGEVKVPPESLAKLDLKRIPRHVAIVMDGNRRWARKHLLPKVAGHWRGAEALSRIVKIASELGVKVLTLYSFSTENWHRSEDEVSALMYLIRLMLQKETDNMVRQGVKFDTIGDLSKFPEEVKRAVEETKRATQGGTKMELVLALNYGARDEIKRAALKIAEDLASGALAKESVSEQIFSSYLDTKKWPDPELLIRTSGEARLSNFLLWQLSYAEIYFTKTFWPDFSERDLVEAIADYQKRDRRLGG